MSYISEIFDRLNVQHIREFLLNGVECVEISNKSYKQRADEAGKDAIAMIEAKFPDIEEREKIINEVFSYVGAVEDIYMEIGIQCGANLANLLLTNSQKE